MIIAHFAGGTLIYLQDKTPTNLGESLKVYWCFFFSFFLILLVFVLCSVVYVMTFH